MPLYPFRADDGTEIERLYPMREAPPLGTEIEQDGKVYRRVVARMAGIQDRGFMPFVDMTVMDHHPAAPRVNKDGRPVFLSQREVNDFIARHNDSGTSTKRMVWDR